MYTILHISFVHPGKCLHFKDYVFDWFVNIEFNFDNAESSVLKS